jgi:hypothetical protein
MRRIDELHLEWPFLGSRMLRNMLRLKGIAVGRKHVATLMRGHSGDLQACQYESAAPSDTESVRIC